MKDPSTSKTLILSLKPGGGYIIKIGGDGKIIMSNGIAQSADTSEPKMKTNVKKQEYGTKIMR